jgi:hypothetical protein
MNQLLLLGLLSGAAATNGSTAITFKPAYDDWPIFAEAAGQISSSEDAFTVTLDSVKMTASGKSLVRLRGYRVCIAYQSKAPEWAIANCSPRINHPAKLHPGESEILDPATLVIPKKNLPEMAKSWFIVEVQITNPPSQEIAHVYSNGDVGFGGTP